MVRGAVEPPTSRFQMDVSPFSAVHISVFPLVSGISVFTPIRVLRGSPFLWLQLWLQIDAVAQPPRDRPQAA